MRSPNFHHDRAWRPRIGWQLRTTRLGGRIPAVVLLDDRRQMCGSNGAWLGAHSASVIASRSARCRDGGRLGLVHLSPTAAHAASSASAPMQFAAVPVRQSCSQGCVRACTTTEGCAVLASHAAAFLAAASLAAAAVEAAVAVAAVAAVVCPLAARPPKLPQASTSFHRLPHASFGAQAPLRAAACMPS